MTWRTFWSRRLVGDGVELRQWRAAAELWFRHSGVFRGAESERGRGKSEGAWRAASGPPYPLAAAAGGELVAGSELARSLQRAEEDDPGNFANRPLAVFFFFFSGPFPFVFLFF